MLRSSRALERARRWALPVAIAVTLLALAITGLSLGPRPVRVVAAGPGGDAPLAGPRAQAYVTTHERLRARASEVRSEVVEAPLPSAPGGRTALIVGINHAAGHRPLQGAVRDAENLRRALIGYGFPPGNITVLEEGRATAGRILSELDRLAQRSPPGGRAVFMFAGHTGVSRGTNHFVAADGGLISAGTVATKLARVRAPLWVALPTCYAGGYQIPGIVGRGRIATFASSASDKSYEIGNAGSYLVLYMVEYAMVDREAPASVESAFGYAKAAIDRVNPDREPYMVDGFPGDMVLGAAEPAASKVQPSAGDGVSGSSDGADEQPAEPPPSSNTVTASVCGPRVSVRCGDA